MIENTEEKSALKQRILAAEAAALSDADKSYYVFDSEYGLQIWKVALCKDMHHNFPHSDVSLYQFERAARAASAKEDDFVELFYHYCCSLLDMKASPGINDIGYGDGHCA